MAKKHQVRNPAVSFRRGQRHADGVLRHGARAACVLLIAIAAVWAYWPSFDGVLVLDDFDSIANNPSIRSLTPLSRPLSPPPLLTLSGRPVANLSFALNYRLADPTPRDHFDVPSSDADPNHPAFPTHNLWGYHATNLAIHVLAALLLFGVMRRTLVSPRLKQAVGGDRDATIMALAASLIWLVHPLQTEAVTYLVQRVESLMGLFFLLTVYAAIRVSDSRHPYAWTAVSVSACALGMGTKEAMVAAPIVTWLWHRTFGGEPVGGDGRRLWPLYAGLAATWILLAVIVAGNHRSLSAGFYLRGWTPAAYLLTQTGVIVHYLKLSIVPAPLVFAAHWPRVNSILPVLPQATFLALVAAGTIFGCVRRHPLGFAGAWFLLTLAPSSSILPIVTEVAAEHRMYLPLAAVVGTIVVGVAAIIRLLPGLQDATWRRAVAVLVAMAVLMLGAMTRARNRDYASEERLWHDTVVKQPHNPRALMSYGVALLAGGGAIEAQIDAASAAKAEPYLQASVDLDDRDPEALLNLAASQQAQGKLAQAIRNLERAVALRPDYVSAHRNLAEAYVANHEPARAVPHFERVLRERPNSAGTYHRLAWVLATTEDADVRNPGRAVVLAERAVALSNGQDAMFLNTLGVAYVASDRLGAASDAMRRAASVAREQGRLDEAAGLEKQVEAIERRRQAAR